MLMFGYSLISYDKYILTTCITFMSGSSQPCQRFKSFNNISLASLKIQAYNIFRHEYHQFYRHTVNTAVKRMRRREYTETAGKCLQN